jgi:hypothetical protein
MAKIHLDSDGRLVIARTLYRHKGKMGASINPARAALVRLMTDV